MAIGVEKPALPMRSPRHFMVPHRIVAIRPRCHSATDERVWIIYKYLYTHCRGAQRDRALPAIVLWLGEEEGRSMDLQTDDGAKVPKLGCAKSALIPSGCGL